MSARDDESAAAAAGGAGAPPPPHPPPLAEDDDAYERRLKLTDVIGLVAQSGYAREADACAGLNRETWRCLPPGLSAADADRVRRNHPLWQAIINLPHRQQKQTRLMLAVEKASVAHVRDLIAWHADLEARDVQGSTALGWACCIPDGDTCGFVLVNSGADVNAIGDVSCRYSVLLDACATGKALLVRRLLKAGADKSYVASDGKTAMDVINSLYLGGYREEIRNDIVKSLNAA